MDSVLERLIEAVTDSEDLESLTRPLLSIMVSMTGLDSAYLTAIDGAEQQRILYARNEGLANWIPEGLTVNWKDTLCRRALADQCPLTTNVASRWPDAEKAIGMGITTYFSVPVESRQGHILGTICAIDRRSVPISAEHQRIIRMFATLVGREWERDLLLEQLRQDNREISRYALTDPLTGVSNRRGMEAELARLLANARRQGLAVQLAFIDLDGFKGINDEYGHDAGDRFLLEIARRLSAGTRQGDVVARYGGDEFVVFGLDSPAQDSAAWQQRLHQQTVGQYELSDRLLDYAGASVGVVTSTPDDTAADLLKRGDAAMYRIKQGRRPRS